MHPEGRVVIFWICVLGMIFALTYSLSSLVL